MNDRIQQILLSSVKNLDGLPSIYKQHELTNVSVSSRFPEKGRGGAIFGSLVRGGVGLFGGGVGVRGGGEGGGGGVGSRFS